MNLDNIDIPSDNAFSSTNNNFSFSQIPQIPPSPISKTPQLIGLIVLLCLFGAGTYYLGTKKSVSPSVGSPTNYPSSVPTVSSEPLFSGQIKKIVQDLKLFALNQEDISMGVVGTYYEAGQFNRGELKDYTRVIAIRNSSGPGEPISYTLATKDFNTYILDDSLTPDSSYLDNNKIISTKKFDTDQPSEILLNSQFSLYSTGFSTDTISTSKTDSYGNEIYESILTTDLSLYQKLNSPSENISVYFKPYTSNLTNYNQLPQSEKDIQDLTKKYVLGNTQFLLVDNVGLPVSYSLTTPQDIKKYNSLKARGSDEYFSLPALSINSSDLVGTKDLTFYKDYKTAIPGGCAISLDTKIVNVSDSDLEAIGTVSNLPVYRLKDINHPLYRLAFQNKLNSYDLDPSYWNDTNPGIKKPNFTEYVNKNPLLFVKDYWQQWVALGEYDINLPGGCGKPVIYLYPTVPTQISVKFQVPVQFTTDIPKYQDSWSVLAQPNGLLTDQKYHASDCQSLDFQKIGSEYARQACQSNSYPYLYWAGNVLSHVDYPVINQGWVIEKNSLNQFFENKLTEIGLNSQEKNDFISYWLPEMLKKDASYYQIKFLQTKELNSLFPMTVQPQPETIFRLFLDYTPLVSQPDNLPQPQTLRKLIRNGFTLVEWGGLKKH